MAGIRPLIIVDSTALLATQLRQWQEWASFGACVLPQTVWQEIDFLTRRAVTPAEEEVARAFLRFHESARTFEVSAGHVLLGNPAGVTGDPSQSKRARLSQTIAECAYALAKQQPQVVVILLSHDRLLVERVNHLGIPNLGSISVPQLTQWIRQDLVPAAVQTILNAMKEPPVPAIKVASVPSQRSLKSLSKAAHPTPVEIPPFVARPQPVAPPPVSSRPLPPPPKRGLWRQITQGIRTVFGVVLIVVSIGILIFAGLVAWRIYDPQGSEWLWQTLRLPEVPR
ncbi:MAG: PIN domain-containing protein [Cyanophyceae cyanobacterium]